MRRRFAEAELFAENDPCGLNIGFMKTDRLLDGSFTRSALLAKYGIDGSRPVLLYAPTGQKYNSLETTGLEVIRRIAETKQSDLIIKTPDHPRKTDAECFRSLPTLTGPPAHRAEEQNVIPLAHLADVLITDAASVSNEYALLDQPIIFLAVPQLIKRARKAEGSMVDLRTWGRRIGTVVKTPKEISGALEQALTCPEIGSPERRQLVADVFYNLGEATNAAMQWLQQNHLPESAAATADSAPPVPVGNLRY